MKIYNKIVFDYNFNIIEEDSFEYEGEVALCDGDGGGDASDQGMADAQANSIGMGGMPDGDVSAQGMADAQANSIGMGGMPDTTGAAMADLDAANIQVNLSPVQAQAIAKAADKAVADNTFSWGSFAKSVAKGAIVGMPAGITGMTFGALTGAVKGAIDQFGAISQSVSAPSFSSATGTNTASNTTSGMDSQGGNSVWDGNSFVSPTSPSGQQAVAQAQSQGTTGATNMANLSLEDQLKQEQLNILRKQSLESDQLSKLLYQSAGLVKDQATGEWRQATEEEHVSFMTDTEKQEYAIYKQQLTRQQQALGGKLPISPALEREISDWDAQNKEELTRRLGSGYMTSTPGIQSQNRQQERTGLLREEARRGEITAGSSRLTDWRTSLNNQNAQQLNALGAIPNRTSGLLTGYSNALVPYTAASNQAAQIGYYQNRDSQVLAQDAYNQKQSMDARNKAGMWSTIGTLGGYLFS